MPTYFTLQTNTTLPWHLLACTSCYKTNKGICVCVLVAGYRIWKFVDLQNYGRKCYGFVLGIKRCFDELFDGYLVEESMWGFRVCKEEQKERI